MEEEEQGGWWKRDRELDPGENIIRRRGDRVEPPEEQKREVAVTKPRNSMRTWAECVKHVRSIEK